MTPLDFRMNVIRPALHQLDLWSVAGEDLMLGVALQESGLHFTRQLGGGPALGYWQMEPATHDDCWRNFLDFRITFANRIGLLASPIWRWSKGLPFPNSAQLATNHKYACAMARIKFFRSPLELPAAGDIGGYARAWKQVYNTAGGKGTEEEFIANWEKNGWNGLERF